MRKSREEAGQTRKRIVEAASCEFRRNGIVATGLNNLMKAAGTKDYNFSSLEDFIVAKAFTEGLKRAV